MKYTTTRKYVRTSPRKLREVLAVIKDLTPEKAVEVLPFVEKRAATPLLKAIKTALASIPDEKKGGKVTFGEIQVTEGPRQKRWRAGSRGRAKPFKKKSSHIRIVLEVEEKQIKDKKKITAKSKKETKKEVKK